jgi:hypothetical protein
VGAQATSAEAEISAADKVLLVMSTFMISSVCLTGSGGVQVKLPAWR